MLKLLIIHKYIARCDLGEKQEEIRKNVAEEQD